MHIVMFILHLYYAFIIKRRKKRMSKEKGYLAIENTKQNKNKNKKKQPRVK